MVILLYWSYRPANKKKTLINSTTKISYQREEKKFPKNVRKENNKNMVEIKKKYLKKKVTRNNSYKTKAWIEDKTLFLYLLIISSLLDTLSQYYQESNLCIHKLLFFPLHFIIFFFLAMFISSSKRNQLL